MRCHQCISVPVEVCVCEFIIWLGPKCYWLRSRVSSLAQVLTRFFLIQSDKSGTCPIMIEYHQSLCDESVFNPAKWLWLQGTPKTNGSSLFSALSFWINLRQSEGISMPESLRSSCSGCSASLGPAWEMCFLWSFLLRLGVRGHVSSCF